MRVGPITPSVPTTLPLTSYGAVTTLISSTGISCESPPMKICTPVALLETSSNCIRLVFCSNMSNSLRSELMLDDRSLTDNKLRSPEMTTSSLLSVMASLPASTAACIRRVMSSRSWRSSACSRVRTSSKLRPP